MSSPTAKRAVLAWVVAVLAGCDALAPRDLTFGQPPLPTGSTMDAGVEMSPVDEPVLIVVEAERYDLRDPQGTPRDFYVTSASESGPAPDPDVSHAESASEHSYLEVLPDTRVSEADPLKNGLFTPAGVGPLVSYSVAFAQPGAYYLWIRGFSTGSEDETIFVSIDKAWDSAVAAKLCSGATDWQWASHHRVDKFSCGMLGQLVLEVDTPGLHTVTFAAREDGFELDKWLLTTDPSFVPRELGPDATLPTM